MSRIADAVWRADLEKPRPFHRNVELRLSDFEFSRPEVGVRPVDDDKRLVAPVEGVEVFVFYGSAWNIDGVVFALNRGEVFFEGGDVLLETVRIRVRQVVGDDVDVVSLRRSACY